MAGGKKGEIEFIVGAEGSISKAKNGNLLVVSQLSPSATSARGRILETAGRNVPLLSALHENAFYSAGNRPDSQFRSPVTIKVFQTRSNIVRVFSKLLFSGIKGKIPMINEVWRAATIVVEVRFCQIRRFGAVHVMQSPCFAFYFALPTFAASDSNFTLLTNFIFGNSSIFFDLVFASCQSMKFNRNVFVRFRILPMITEIYWVVCGVIVDSYSQLIYILKFTECVFR